MADVSRMSRNVEVAILVLTVFYLYFTVVAFSDETERIINGELAENGQFPWAVALYYEGIFTCTASLISTMTVLTAAHCVEKDGILLSASYFHGIAGNVNRSAPDTRLKFSSVTIHPQYANMQKDIAFFTLIESVELSEDINPVCIARSETGINEYSDAVAMGWGTIRSSHTVMLDDLMYAEMKLLPHVFCRARYLSATNRDHICGDGFGSGICYGDSGGPLVHMSSSFIPPVQIGVASFINNNTGCGSLLVGPGVFTRVSSYTNWILEASQDSGICTM